MTLNKTTTLQRAVSLPGGPEGASGRSPQPVSINPPRQRFPILTSQPLTGCILLLDTFRPTRLSMGPRRPTTGEIPQHIVTGLGKDRVTRITIAYEHATRMLDAYPIKRRSQDQLAELIIRESRDPNRTIGEIAVRAISKLPPPPSVAVRLRSRIREFLPI
jgi:hypothetical protein